jgi:hypothetical protein
MRLYSQKVYIADRPVGRPIKCAGKIYGCTADEAFQAMFEQLPKFVLEVKEPEHPAFAFPKYSASGKASGPDDMSQLFQLVVYWTMRTRAHDYRFRSLVEYNYQMFFD